MRGVASQTPGQSNAYLSRRSVLRLGASGLAVGLAGCLGFGSNDSAEWTTFAHNAANTGATDAEGPTDPTVRWSHDAGAGVIASSAVADGIVYVPDRQGLNAFDLETGDEVASFDRFGGELRGTPTVVDETVYVTMAGNGHLYAFDTDGTKQWDENIGPTQHPVVVDGTIYIQTVEDYILRTRALEADSGDEAWAVDYGHATAPLWTPAVVDETVYVTVRAIDDEVNVAAVAALDTETGDERWRTDVTEEFTPLSSPAVDDGALFVLGEDSLAAFDTDSGDRLWLESHSFPSSSGPYPLEPPAVTDETIYAGIGARNQHSDDGSAVIAVDRESGEEEWTVETNYPGESVSIAGDAIYANTLGAVYALEPEDGAIRWEYDSAFSMPSDQTEPTSPPSIVDGVAVVGTPAGGVYVLEDG